MLPGAAHCGAAHCSALQSSPPRRGCNGATAGTAQHPGQPATAPLQDRRPRYSVLNVSRTDRRRAPPLAAQVGGIMPQFAKRRNTFSRLPAPLPRHTAPFGTAICPLVPRSKPDATALGNRWIPAQTGITVKSNHTTGNAILQAIVPRRTVQNHQGSNAPAPACRPAYLWRTS